ncbi:MAG: hypothetical protein L0H75_01235 [Nitrosospira sp.]|nr:hypothetical protein [Nitrosospira sp.]
MTAFFRKHPYWLVCAAAVLGAAVYWSLLVTGRYVSRATVALHSAASVPAAARGDTAASLFAGGGSQRLLALREYLLSTDVLKELDAALDLRSHFASKDIDFLSRLASPQVPLARFHDYFLGRVSVKLNESAQVLRIQAQAYDPQTAHAIVAALLREGKKHRTSMSRHLAVAQIEFIADQVKKARQRRNRARGRLRSYQNAHAQPSPAGEKGRDRRDGMTARSGAAQRRVPDELETLQAQLAFANDLYASALATLGRTRSQAARGLWQLAVLQSPTMPEAASAPRRLHNIFVFAVLAVLAALVIHLLTVIVRDHLD